VAGKFCGTFFVKMLKLALNLPVPAKIGLGKIFKKRVFQRLWEAHDFVSVS
jgi:hypothetical protein